MSEDKKPRGRRLTYMLIGIAIGAALSEALGHVLRAVLP